MARTMRLSQVIEGDLNLLHLYTFDDGFTVESVFYRGDTLCVSTQVGCHVRCGFCASGREGLLRNLTAEEIINQFLLSPFRERIQRIAVAGIGEPLMNWREVLKAFYMFREMGLRVSFYTSGFPLDKLGELIDINHNGLTVSIHSLHTKVRKRLMPGSGRVEDLIGFLEDKVRALSRRKRSRISLAYLLLKGVNDSSEDAINLGRTAGRLGLSVTLLRFNRVGDYEASDEERYVSFFRILRSMGVKVTLSTRFRRDKIGGCGTLVINRKEDDMMEVRG